MRIAVIGAGVSGLGAARELSRDHHVEVFERASNLGGHVHTVSLTSRRAQTHVDIGFIVFNPARYPRFTSLLRELSVATRPTDMSFGVRCERTGIEYSTAGIDGWFAQRRNALRTAHYRLIAHIVLLLRAVRRSVARHDASDISLGEWLARERIARDAIELFLLPLGASLWSTAAARILDFPAETFLEFCQNHGILDVFGAAKWRTVVGGSDTYVRALVSHTRATFNRETAIVRLERSHRGVVVVRDSGRSERFDRAIVATHADQALALLADPTADERRILGAIGYTANDTVLHTDDSFLPTAAPARASWNFLVRRDADGAPPLVTYWMNRLQGLPGPERYCVTLNPDRPIADAHVLARVRFEHPQFDAAARIARRDFARVQGTRGTWYCGAYLGYGFHEDGLRAGIVAAQSLASARDAPSVEHAE